MTACRLILFEVTRVLIAPDKFKGSCTAREATEAIARGFRAAWPEAMLKMVPMADGGEGFAEAVKSVHGGEWIEVEVADPLRRRVLARYLWVEGSKLAVIDVSEASGLSRVAVHERQPMTTTSLGTGELIMAAARRGALTIIVGVGGSATTDGGLGIAAALGFRLIAKSGEAYAAGLATLMELASVQPPPGRFSLPRVIAATDVANPLLGMRGAARVFSPQKGATAAEIDVLEAGLTNLAHVVKRDLGTDFHDEAGAGAGGGIQFGLLSFCGAQGKRGFQVISELVGLSKQVRESDLVITGEGCIDAQTAEGKAPAGVAQLAREHGKPVIAFAGSVDADQSVIQLFDSVHPIVDKTVPLSEALSRGQEFLERAAARVAARLRAS